MNTPHPDPVVIKRAKAYVAKMAAIQGTDLSAGVAAAHAIILGFNLGMENGVAILKSDYAARCSPPLSDQQVAEIALRAVREPGNKPAGSLLRDEGGRKSGLSDLGNAQYLVKCFGDELRFCHDWDTWFIWDGTRWKKDRTEGVFRKAIESIRKHQLAAIRGALSTSARKHLLSHLLRSEHEARIRAVVELARKLEPLPVLPEQFDTDPWKLNCWNGTLDLRTGKLQPHRREDLNTKIVPFTFDPAASCPQWLKFLDKVMAGNQTVIEFIQRLAGYSLTGVVTEHCMAILYGDGKNGKSTFIETIRFVLNDYAIEAAPGLLVEQHNTSHPTEIADLHGARFASNSEIGQGQKLDEAKFKRLTGDDRLKARKMYQDFYEFLPTHKLWMCTNHKPVIRETKEAVWRRLFLIPFLVVIPDAEVDKNLRDKLKAEAAGILAWMVRGCLTWQRGGLNPPPEVLQATKEYREEMDVLGQFILEKCVIEKQTHCGASEVYNEYKTWSEQQGLNPFSQKRFGTYLKSRPEVKTARESSGRVIYEGIRLRGPNDALPGPPAAPFPSGRNSPVAPLEFAKAECVVLDGHEIDSSRIYEAYFDYCKRIGRPEVSMTEIDAFFESGGQSKVVFEDESYFRGLGLLVDFPELVEDERSEASKANCGTSSPTVQRTKCDPSDPSDIPKPMPISEQEFGKLLE